MEATTNTWTMTACPSDQVGDIKLMGRFGGAYCYHWRVCEKTATEIVLERVEPHSVKNDDGTYSTVYESA